jgi:hypothetical protein
MIDLISDGTPGEIAVPNPGCTHAYGQSVGPVQRAVRLRHSSPRADVRRRREKLAGAIDVDATRPLAQVVDELIRRAD